ncbi:MAG TPA: DegT/DnrJ/EryC1/StrS family aminotransferase [Steroidobacteraceae bacterium]|nr:DegT/DnrJ/EryC1/StrS family aminotransferase [Steroidobacteraceae bacterium]
MPQLERSAHPSASAPTPAARAMKVPLLDLTQQYQGLAAQVLPALQKICESQQFILGAAVAQFEREAASYCRCREAIGVSSGTDALLLALMGLGIGAGDEVLTTPYSFFATAGTIARVGARPVFCDIEADSFNLNPLSVRDWLQSHAERRGGRLVDRDTGGTIRALLPVHLYGQCARMSELREIAREFALPIIEDAAQAIGADTADGQRAGSIGEIGCLSFFPTKNLGAFGDAGMCTTQDPQLAEHLRVLRVHGGKPKYHHAFIGGNFRIDELQAAVLSIKLQHLDEWSAARQRNARHYGEAFDKAGLSARIGLPQVPRGARHVWNQYVVRVPQRDALRAHLTAEGVGTEIYYPIPLHLQPCFSYLGHRPGDFPLAEQAAEQSLALPIFPELQVQQLDYVVDRIAAFYS